MVNFKQTPAKTRLLSLDSEVFVCVYRVVAYAGQLLVHAHCYLYRPSLVPFGHRIPLAPQYLLKLKSAEAIALASPLPRALHQKCLPHSCRPRSNSLLTFGLRGWTGKQVYLPVRITRGLVAVASCYYSAAHCSMAVFDILDAPCCEAFVHPYV